MSSWNNNFSTFLIGRIVPGQKRHVSDVVFAADSEKCIYFALSRRDHFLSAKNHG